LSKQRQSVLSKGTTRSGLLAARIELTA
jgi:hypothetical protein